MNREGITISKLIGTIYSDRRTKEKQERKHVSMMTKSELSLLSAWAKERPVEKMKISTHLQGKDSVSLNPWDIKRVLESEKLEDLIVEFSKRFGYSDNFTQRILIRDNKDIMVEFKNRNGETFEALGNLCFVVDLTTWTLITAYWNKASDNHSTIDFSYYSTNLEISN